MLSAEQLKSQLSHFTGTDNYYKHWLGFQYTDGIKFLADNAECYWLLDAIRATRRLRQRILPTNNPPKFETARLSVVVTSCR
ncbi:MAG: DUF6876 family protein [Phormidium sp.]